MTTPILRLECGRTSYDLNNQVRFFLHQDFIPPAVSVSPLFAAGTSANRDGAQLVDRRPANRSFSFRVNMRGASTLEMRTWLGRLQNLLNLAGNQQEPVHLVWKENSDTPEPLWGQYGAAFYYEVVFGNVVIAPGYLVGARIATDFDLEFSLVLKPFAKGLAQRVASATGRLHEDMLGVTDGVSRGLVLGRNHTNKCTNPVFGHATYDTGWTADASLTASKNVYREFLAPGATASALLISRSTNQEFYQSINVGNTQTHTFLALVMRPDFGTVTSDDAVLFYSSALTTTFTDLGGGLYAMTATATGINASTNTGIQVKNGRTIYLLYYGAVDTDDGWFFPFWGDNLGCAWSGTAHNSTSTSTAGRVRLPVAGDTVAIAQGSLRMVLKIPQSANFVNPVFFSFGATSLRGGLTLSTMTLTMTDGGGTISVDGLVTAGQTVCLHYVWGSNGTKIYLNGVQVAGGTPYTLPAAPTYLYLGTDDTPTAQTENPIYDIATWAEQLTAAQISADYDTIDELMDDRLRIAPFPWLWTKDGDDVVDNCDDSSRDNWCVVGGVPGSEAAKSLFNLTPSNGSSVMYLARAALGTFWYPTAPQFYADFSGTVDANSSGGQYTALIATDSTAVTNLKSALSFNGKLVFVSRVKAGGAGSKMSFALNLGSAILCNPSSQILPSGVWSYAIAEAAVAIDEVLAGMNAAMSCNVVAGSQAINVDYMVVIPGDIMYISNTTAPVYILDDVVRLNDGRIVSTKGSIINLIPNTINMLWAFSQDNNFNDVDITDTVTFTQTTITPRYTLL